MNPFQAILVKIVVSELYADQPRGWIAIAKLKAGDKERTLLAIIPRAEVYAKVATILAENRRELVDKFMKTFVIPPEYTLLFVAAKDVDNDADRAVEMVKTQLSQKPS